MNRRPALYETDNGTIQVRPVLTPDQKLAHIEIFSPSSKTIVYAGLIAEVREILEAIEERYIHKEKLEI